MRNKYYGMATNTSIFLVIILFLQILRPVSIWGQEPRSDNELEEMALQAFEKKDYENALGSFDRLLKKYPRDPRFNYYSGVCLVQIGRLYNTAILQLKLASLGDTPPDVYYYIGRAYYHIGNPSEARYYYVRYEELSSREDQRTHEFEKWKSFVGNDARQQPTLQGQRPSANDRSTEYDKDITNALEMQEKADSARMAADELRNQKDAAGISTTDINTGIANLEKEAADFQQSANEYFLKARDMEKSGQLTSQKTRSDPYMDDLVTSVDDIPGRGSNPYFEQVPDAFYEQREISRILRVTDLTRLYELDEMNRSGNQLMREAYELERERDQQKVVASAAATAIENRKARTKVERLDRRIADKKLNAFLGFQQINDGKFEVYKGTLDQILSNQDIANFSLIKQYAEDAKTSHDKAMDKRAGATNLMDQDKKFDTYAEANAYELLAIHNQKMALGTFAGIIPVRFEPDYIASKQMTPQQLSQPDNIKSGEQEESAVVLKETMNHTTTEEKKDIKSDLPGKEIRETEIRDPDIETDNTSSEALTGESNPITPDWIVNEFAVLPTPDYNEMLPIPMDETLPEGIIYKIQVAAYRSTKPQSFFRGLEPLTAEHIGYAIRYFAGRFSLYQDAREALKTVKKNGFRDAFVVAYINGVKTAVERARTLEPEFEGRISADVAEYAPIKSEVEPVARIHFRLQLGAYSKEIGPDLLATFKFYAGSKNVTYIKNNEGLYIYTLGNFSTFEEASAYNDEIKEQGFTEAFIIGMKDGQKIPASEARNLLDND